LVGALGRTAGDGNWGAVHVHLAVADSVEPSPSQSVLSSGDAFGHLEAEIGVAIRVQGGAAALEGLDHLPRGGLGGLEVFCQTDLAGTAAVDGAAFECELHILADGEDCLGCGGLKGVIAKLAGEVTAICRQRRVVESGLAVRGWVAHNHVSIDHRSAHEGNHQVEHHRWTLLGELAELGFDRKMQINSIRARRMEQKVKGLDLGGVGKNGELEGC
jgi:hypothetical protein